jgi:hypothetical protein
MSHVVKPLTHNAKCQNFVANAIRSGALWGKQEGTQQKSTDAFD